MVVDAHQRIRRFCVVIAFCCAWLAAVGPRAAATTIEPMTLVTAADYAAQVIDARIEKAKARWVENPRRIETVLTLANVTYLKGGNTAAPSTFELVVPGGRMGSIQMRIAGAPELRPGDRWILFLLPRYKTYPVVGLTQGAFRVDEREPTATRVMDASGRGVVRVRRNGVVDVAGVQRTATGQRLRGTDRVRLLQRAQQSVRVMTVDEFVAALRPLLAASRRYDLVQPAGQPHPPVFKPTTIKPSDRERRESAMRTAKAPRGRAVTRRHPVSHAKGRNR